MSSIVLTAELPSIYVAEVSADEESYRAKVSAAIFAMRRRARMTQEEFALSLSRELGREIRGNKVTQWERGTFLPKSDILLASMAISGVEPKDLGIDPRAVTAIELNRLHRQIRVLEAEKNGEPAPIAPRKDLELADGELTDYLIVEETAVQLGVSRQWVYHLMGKGQLTGYRLGSGTVFLKTEVEALVKKREKKR